MVEETKTEEKDSTYAVKLDSAVKKDLQALLEGYKQQDIGANAGDFIKTLLEIYKTNKIVSKVSNADVDIKELNTLVNRIYSIYGNILERNNTNIDNLQLELAQQLIQKDNVINSLKVKIEAITTEQELLTEAYNDSCEDKKELDSNSIQLQKLNNSLEFNNSKLVEDTKGLLLLKEVNNKLLNEIETLKSILATQQASNSELKDILKNNDFNISELNKKVEALTKDNVVSLEQLKDKQIIEMQQLKDKSSILSQREVLSLQKLHQEQLSQEQNKHNSIIETYQSKYKALLEELENVRSVPKGRSITKAKPKETK
ncbi:hypothetical protein [uncultured Clostridium sp.]|uniref:hypothetical protein n=1 Tax=uncultured Clostridium sp. TaxID=59620 RepID=UPI00263500B5|nr:hypothetical protein [uncultured Clostridium sp.]